MFPGTGVISPGCRERRGWVLMSPQPHVRVGNRAVPSPAKLWAVGSARHPSTELMLMVQLLLQRGPHTPVTRAPYLVSMMTMAMLLMLLLFMMPMRATWGMTPRRGRASRSTGHRGSMWVSMRVVTMRVSMRMGSMWVGFMRVSMWVRHTRPRAYRTGRRTDSRRKWIHARPGVRPRAWSRGRGTIWRIWWGHPTRRSCQTKGKKRRCVRDHGTGPSPILTMPQSMVQSLRPDDSRREGHCLISMACQLRSKGAGGGEEAEWGQHLEFLSNRAMNLTHVYVHTSLYCRAGCCSPYTGKSPRDSHAVCLTANPCFGHGPTQRALKAICVPVEQRNWP